MRRQVVAIVMLGIAAATALSACTADPEPSVQVTVTGEPGSAPTLEYDTPLEVTSPSVEVIRVGDGPEVVDGQPILVNYYAESGADSSLINETYSREPKPYVLSAEELGVDIYEALLGQTVGSRVLHLVPPAEGQAAATIAVFDVLPTRASGEQVELREGLPTVELAENGAPSIIIAQTDPPTEPPTDLMVQPLIRGAGPQVSPGQVITVQFTGVTWSAGEVVDSTWGAGKLPTPFPIGVGSVMKGWDTGLIEQTVGSQVMLIVPPRLGFGSGDTELAEETLVFVVDILAASGGPTIG